ncbi:PorP/SprF family type IX secretion system membrane protein [Limibacter armeniacum]|uniref:PorP/SprF family type IX secretion system membrane protein n=1 Tax=Limibacter armeniacum TaxID=466084 RepID=UPI002FE5D4F7
MKNRLILLLIILLTGTMAQAQSLNDTYFYTQNFYKINPAATPGSGHLQAMVHAHLQQMSPEGLPSQRMGLSLNAGLGQIAVGGNLLYTQQGFLNSTKASLSFAYTLEVTREASMSFGLSAGVSNDDWRFESSQLQGVDLTDPYLEYGTGLLKPSPTIGFGTVLNWKQLTVGISSSELMRISDNYFSIADIFARYEWELNEQVTLAPIVAATFHNVEKTVTDIHLQAILREKLWLSTGYRSTGKAMFSSGLEMGLFKVSYAYLHNFGQLSTFNDRQHEVAVLFDIETNSKSKGRSARTRYRRR